MNFDCYELILKVDVGYTGSSDQALHLVEQVAAGVGAQVGKIHFGCHLSLIYEQGLVVLLFICIMFVTTKIQ